jgi:hypothetical protein
MASKVTLQDWLSEDMYFKCDELASIQFFDARRFFNYLIFDWFATCCNPVSY